ncbi:hypothetical protein NEPAR05_2274 [Nematocida parisii]|nr:hypothetical protein NEPAR05_2274 [Nematocida parisii]
MRTLKTKSAKSRFLSAVQEDDKKSRILFNDSRIICVGKRFYLIALLIIYKAVARLELDDLLAHQSSVIKGEKEEYIINPKGPLNLLRGYIYYKKHFMLNKRLFSPELDIRYEIILDTADDSDNVKYLYKRSPQNDTVRPLEASSGPKSEDKYRCQEQEKLKRYTIGYHRKLLQMFTIQDNGACIETGRGDSLTTFLRYTRVKEHSMAILATLLLLTEGIKVPIKYVSSKENMNTQLIIQKKNRIQEHLSVSMHVPYKCPISKRTKSVMQKEAKGIFNFFISHQKSSFLKWDDALIEPNTLEKFNSGRFLNSLPFLIQMYIFEFIDNIEDANKFIFAVYEILKEYSEENESKEEKETDHAISVFNRCFVPANQLEASLTYIDNVKKVKSLEAMRKSTPFLNSVQVFTFSRIPMQNLPSSDELKHGIEYFANCVESSILSLVCCFMYDPILGEYTTSHLPNAMPKLHSFFMKYKMPTEFISLEMHQKWNEIVSNLENKEVLYCNKGNELMSGIINIAAVLIEITGISHTFAKNIYQFKSIVNSEQEITNEMLIELATVLEDIFLALSVNKSLKLSMLDIVKCKRSDPAYDLFGCLSIKYKVCKNKQKFCIKISSFHTQSAVIGSKRSIRTASSFILNTPRKYEDPNDFFSHLVNSYIDVGLKRLINCAENIKNTDFIEEICHAAKTDFINVNRILMLDSIYTLQSKFNILEYCSIYMCNKNLDKDYSGVKFTSNILGIVHSFALSNVSSLLSVIIYTGVYKFYGSKIKINTKGNWPVQLPDSKACLGLFNSIVSIGNKELLVDALDVFMSFDTGERPGDNVILLIKELSHETFRLLLKDEDPAYAQKLIHIMKARYHGHGHTLSNIVCCIWLFYACNDEDISIETICLVFDMVQPYCDKDIFNFIYTPDNCSHAINVFKSMKIPLYGRNNGKKKYDKIANVIKEYQRGFNTESTPGCTLLTPEI